MRHTGTAEILTCIKYITTVLDANLFSIRDLEPALVNLPARIILSVFLHGALCTQALAVPVLCPEYSS